MAMKDQKKRQNKTNQPEAIRQGEEGKKGQEEGR